MNNIFKNSLFKKGLGDSSYYLIANIGSRVLGFLIIPILVRIVSVEEFATYDLFLLISSLLQIFIVLGIDSGIIILITEAKEDNNLLSFLYVSSLLINIFLFIILVIIYNIIFTFTNSLFSLQQDTWYLLIWYLLFNIINYQTFNFLRWKAEAKKASFINLFAYMSGILLGLLLVLQNNKINSFLEGLVVGSFLGTIFSLYLTKEYFKNFNIPNNALNLLKELMLLSLPYVPSYIGSNLMQMVDRVVILMLFGKHELGLYAVIIRLSAIPQFIIGTIISGFMPVMYNNYKTKDGIGLIKTFFNTYFISIPIITLLVFLIYTPIVKIFAGEQYLNIAYLFPIALASILYVNGIRVTGFGYTIKRKTYYIIYITFTSIIVNFILSLILGYSLGLAGIILGTLIAGILRTYIHTKISEKLYSFNYNFTLFYFLSVITIIIVNIDIFTK